MLHVIREKRENTLQMKSEDENMRVMMKMRIYDLIDVEL